MADIDYAEMTSYAKKFAHFTSDHEVLLKEVGPQVVPLLPAVTEKFYSELLDIPNAVPFLDGRLESLKKTHLEWMEGLFSGDYGEEYTAMMYHVGIVHVKVKLPTEFMAGGMSQIQQAINLACRELFVDDGERYVAFSSALTGVLGYSLLVMQQSYQEASLAAELEKFLKITGMSRVLFDNLAQAYT